MKRILSCLLLVALLVGCAPKTASHQVTYLNLFDTVTTILSCSGTEAEFQRQTEEIYRQLQTFHRLFDIYNDYEGIQNLKTVNDRAGVEPVQVDPAVIRLLKDCKQYYALTEGRVNVAMGSVLRLWHEARQTGTIPDRQALDQAAAHTVMDHLILDEAQDTVFLADPQISLDVGAIAKGWAVQRVAEAAPAGLLISVGGNVYVTGPKTGEATPWVIGIQHPDDSGKYLHTLAITGGAVVTSGDYQRYISVDGQKYHHIIDPDTQMPAALWRSVTVVGPDSALADALSTALFLLPLEQGQTLAEKCGVEALWVDPEGREAMTAGFAALLQS